MKNIREEIQQIENSYEEFLLRGDYESAIPLLNQVIELSASDSSSRIRALSNICYSYNQIKQYDKTVRLWEEVKLLYTPSADFMNNVALALKAQGRLEEANALLLRCLERDKFNPIYIFNHAEILFLQGDFPSACELYLELVKKYPEHVSCRINLAACFIKACDYKEALGHLKVANKFSGLNYLLWYNIGICYFELKRFQDAEMAFSMALDQNQDCKDALISLIEVNLKMNSLESALRRCQRLLEKWERTPHDVALMGRVLGKFHRHSEAADFYEDASFRLGHKDFFLGLSLHHRMRACSWEGYEVRRDQLIKFLSLGFDVADPFGFQAICESENLLAKAAELYSKSLAKVPNVPRFSTSRASVKKRIKLGYFSGEFRQHATSILMSGVIEHHDTERFEVLGFDNGFDDSSKVRERLNSSFHKIFDISAMTDLEVRRLCLDLEIDIAINLNGFFGEARHKLFLSRIAPIQVNYLGFPGTLGSDCLDYIIADATVIPKFSFGNYFEKVVWLPNCYQPNDRSRPLIKTEKKADTGKIFIFGCFNNNYKITPDIFRCWMSILSNCPDSHLHLLADNKEVIQNINREAMNSGIDLKRIQFFDRSSYEEYLTNLSRVDLFLDTFPYNAHTTATDAIWVGVPLLTFCGETFPSRVGASILRTLGMEDLICADIEDYRSLAVELGNNHVRYNTVRARLLECVQKSPLFDICSYTRNIEKAYSVMFNNFSRGLSPEHISIN